MDVAAAIRCSDRLQQPGRVAVDDHVLRRTCSAVRAEDEHVDVLPRPFVRAERGCKGGAAHEKCVADLTGFFIRFAVSWTSATEPPPQVRHECGASGVDAIDVA